MIDDIIAYRDHQGTFILEGQDLVHRCCVGDKEDHAAYEDRMHYRPCLRG